MEIQIKKLEINEVVSVSSKFSSYLKAMLK